MKIFIYILVLKSVLCAVLAATNNCIDDNCTLPVYDIEFATCFLLDFEAGKLAAISCSYPVEIPQSFNVSNIQSEILDSDCSGEGPDGVTKSSPILDEESKNNYNITIDINAVDDDSLNVFCLKTKVMNNEGNVMIYRAQLLSITIDITAGFTLTMAVANTPLPPDLQAKSEKRCGVTEADARSNCKPECQEDSDCNTAQSESCFATSSSYCHIMPENHPHPQCDDEEFTSSEDRCGLDEMAGSDFCGESCDSDATCLYPGEKCVSVLPNFCQCFEEQDAAGGAESRSLLGKQHDRRNLYEHISNKEYFLLARGIISEYFNDTIGTIDLGTVSGFEVESFICDKDKVRATAPTSLRMDDGLYVCIRSVTDGIVVKAVIEFNLDKDSFVNGESYKAINDGREDFSTYIQSRGSGTVLVATRVRASFFANDESILIDGEVILGASDSSRYLARFTQEISDEAVTTSNFKMEVNVINATSAASIVITDTLNTFPSTIIGIAVVAFIFF